MDCTDRTLALQQGRLPFQFLRCQVREYESDVACNIRSTGEGDRDIAGSTDGNLSVCQIESEKSFGWSRRHISVPWSATREQNEAYGSRIRSDHGPV